LVWCCELHCKWRPDLSQG